MLGMWSESESTTPMELRTLADWVVRQRLLTIPGVSQVFTMGGGRKQFQILVSPDEMLRFGVTLHDVKQAVSESNENATGGYLDEQGPNELLVRALGRVQSVEDLQKVVVTLRDGRPVALFGANGAGKTNILEAVSLLSPGRGLRRAAAEVAANAA